MILEPWMRYQQRYNFKGCVYNNIKEWSMQLNIPELNKIIKFVVQLRKVCVLPLGLWKSLDLLKVLSRFGIVDMCDRGLQKTVSFIMQREMFQKIGIAYCNLGDINAHVIRQKSHLNKIILKMSYFGKKTVNKMRYFCIASIS